jgi:hypothetical protein
MGLEERWQSGGVELDPRRVELRSNPFDCPQWGEIPVGYFDSANEGSMGSASLNPVAGDDEGCAAFELELELESELLDNDLEPKGPLGEFHESLEFDGASLTMRVEFDRIALSECEEARP